MTAAVVEVDRVVFLFFDLVVARTNALEPDLIAITGDIIEEISKEKRVAIKEQDVIESLDKMGFGHYVPVLEALMRKISDNATAHSLQQNYRSYIRA